MDLKIKGKSRPPRKQLRYERFAAWVAALSTFVLTLVGMFLWRGLLRFGPFRPEDLRYEEWQFFFHGLLLALIAAFGACAVCACYLCFWCLRALKTRRETDRSYESRPND